MTDFLVVSVSKQKKTMSLTVPTVSSKQSDCVMLAVTGELRVHSGKEVGLERPHGHGHGQQPLQ